MKYRIVTNETFEKYIDYMNRGRGRRFEDRWDSLDLDDITADVKPPSDSEVDAAVRELDLFDDAAIKTGAKDVDVAGDGRLRLLDLDDEPAKKKDEPKSLPLGRRARHDAILKDLAKQQADARSKEEPVRELDFDDKGNVKNLKGDEVDDRVRELDYDDKGKDIKSKEHNIGGIIGALDYDDDVDMSNFAASIDDVYTALASNDHRVVKAMIKRYANDIDDVERIKEIMLMHAVRLNYECLRALCGDMRVALTQKEKALGFIKAADIKEALVRFKKIASTLTGANNTFGLIPNAIVSCDQNKQIDCINIIDFLITWCELPLIPIYFRGACINKLYDVAYFILNELPDDALDARLLTGKKGLLTRTKSYDDVPANLLRALCDRLLSEDKIVDLPYNVVSELIIFCLNNGYNAVLNKFDTVMKKLPSRAIGDILLTCLKNKNYSLINKIDFKNGKGKYVANYVEDTDEDMWNVLKKKAKLE
jgi:hypothetical protein